MHLKFELIKNLINQISLPLYNENIMPKIHKLCKKVFYTKLLNIFDTLFFSKIFLGY